MDASGSGEVRCEPTSGHGGGGKKDTRQVFTQALFQACRDHAARPAILVETPRGRRAITFDALQEHVAVLARRLELLCGDEHQRYQHAAVPVPTSPSQSPTSRRRTSYHVSLCLPRSSAYMTCVLACVAAGLVFVPVDVGLPLRRQCHIVAASNSWLIMVAAGTPEATCRELLRAAAAPRQQGRAGSVLVVEVDLTSVHASRWIAHRMARESMDARSFGDGTITMQYALSWPEAASGGVPVVVSATGTGASDEREGEGGCEGETLKGAGGDHTDASSSSQREPERKRARRLARVSELHGAAPDDGAGDVLASGSETDVIAVSANADAHDTRDGRTLYLLFTSGSTGVPKCVAGSTRGTWARLSWMWKVR
jgi:acyl-coenzyme A synthetase/AMP-(fatty) acid ligase